MSEYLIRCYKCNMRSTKTRLENNDGYCGCGNKVVDGYYKPHYEPETNWNFVVGAGIVCSIILGISMLLYRFISALQTSYSPMLYMFVDSKGANNEFLSVLVSLGGILTLLIVICMVVWMWFKE